MVDLQERPADAPQRDWGARKYVGQRLPRVDGVDKVTGRMVYGADISVTGMLCGKQLGSPHAHARIVRIDTEKAKALPGVFAVITGADMPRLVSEISGSEVGGEEFDVASRGKRILAWKKVLFHGEPVAAVAAATASIADQALSLIEVEYDPLPPVIDPIRALAPDAPVLHDNNFAETFAGKADRPGNICRVNEIVKGDVAQGFAEAAVVVEDTFATAVVHQGYIEPQATLAEFTPTGDLNLWTTTQGSFGVRSGVSSFLHIPVGRIKVTPLEVGGSFGAKGAMGVEPLAALLAHAAGRPVKCVLRRSEVLKATRPAPGSVIQVKIGARQDGTFTALEARMVYDVGGYPGGASGAGMNIGPGPYKWPNARVEGIDVMTNKPSVTAYRAPGGPQAAYAIESVVDRIAVQLGMDPIALRLRNAVQLGDRAINDVEWVRVGFTEILEAVRSHACWSEPVPTPSQPGRKRGRGVAAGYWGGGVGTSTAEIHFAEDGAARIVTGSIDLTGCRSAVCQIAAEALDMPFEKIGIKTESTDAVAFNDGTGGSRLTLSLGTAVYRAAVDGREKLRQRAAQQLKADEQDVVEEDGRYYARSAPEVSFTRQQVIRRSMNSGDGPVVGVGNTTHLKRAPAFAVQVAEVEVDEETGQTWVVRFTGCQDVGCAINPDLCEGQIQGSAVQGIGWALTEGYVYDERGLLRNPSLLDYRKLTSLDVPNIDCILVEVPAEESPYGVRGTGEVNIVPTLAAVGNAIYDAIGVQLTETPFSAERVLAAIRQGEPVSRYRGVDIAAILAGTAAEGAVPEMAEIPCEEETVTEGRATPPTRASEEASYTQTEG
jgi:CO/xanthine dehydrogenase Mo-binding subunit